MLPLAQLRMVCVTVSISAGLGSSRLWGFSADGVCYRFIALRPMAALARPRHTDGVCYRFILSFCLTCVTEMCCTSTNSSIDTVWPPGWCVLPFHCLLPFHCSSPFRFLHCCTSTNGSIGTAQTHRRRVLPFHFDMDGVCYRFIFGRTRIVAIVGLHGKQRTQAEHQTWET